MCEVRACARALVQRVAEGGEIPIASLRDLGDLVLRSELMVVSHQVLHGPSEFARKGGGQVKPNQARKVKARIVSFRVDEDDFTRLDALAQQTSYSRAEVLRRSLVGAPLKSTVGMRERSFRS